MYGFIETHYRKILLLIPLLSLVMHLHVFRLDLIGIHVWRQTQTQTVINNFYREDMNILSPRSNNAPDTDRLLRMEFPVMQWIFALFYKIFGDHVIISRILSFLIGLGSVTGMFWLAKVIFRNEVTAVIAAWAFNFSPAFYYYTVNPLPDNMALCCAIWFAVFFFRYALQGKRSGYLWLSAAFLCISVLAKLPFVLYAIIPAVYGAVGLMSGKIRAGEVLKTGGIYCLLLIPPAAWYVHVIPTWHSGGIVTGMLDNQHSLSGIVHILVHNVVSTLPELLINYASVLFFLAAVFFLFRDRLYRHPLFPVLLSWLTAVVLYFLFEMNMIGTVHDYYLFPFLPMIFLLTGYGAYRLLRSQPGFLKVLSGIALCLLPLTAYLRADTRWDEKDPGFNRVVYLHKQELRSLIPEHAYCVIGNDDSHFILLYYIDRKGWSFELDNLTREQLDYYISCGAGYLLTESRVDERPEIKERLKEKIFDKGSFRVYTLK